MGTDRPASSEGGAGWLPPRPAGTVEQSGRGGTRAGQVGTAAGDGRDRRRGGARADPEEIRLLKELEKESSMGAPLVVDGRVPRRVTVVMVDVNGLKAVNDEHGHSQGTVCWRPLQDCSPTPSAACTEVSWRGWVVTSSSSSSPVATSTRSWPRPRASVARPSSCRAAPDCRVASPPPSTPDRGPPTACSMPRTRRSTARSVAISRSRCSPEGLPSGSDEEQLSRQPGDCGQHHPGQVDERGQPDGLECQHGR